MIVGALNPADTLTANLEEVVRAALKQAKKISRPIADRIDLWVEVPHIPHEQLSGRIQNESSHVVQKRVALARQRAAARSGKSSTNSELSARTIEEQGRVTSAASTLLTSAAKKLDLSPRAYHRTLRVARTIADLRASSEVSVEDVLEALQYRPRGMFGFQ